MPWLARRGAGNWTWGVDLWGYLPAPYAPLALGLGTLALAAGARAAIRASRADTPVPGASAATRRPRAQHGLLALQVAACLAFVALLWLARERAHFLGDIRLRLVGIAQVIEGRSLVDVLVQGRAGPLDEAVQIYGTGRLARYLGLPAETAGQLVSCLIGFGYALACLAISRRLVHTPGARLLALAALLTPGYVQIFAGYAESYSLQVALLALWCLALLRERDDSRPPFLGHLAMALVMLAHRSGVLLLPIHSWAWRRTRGAAAGPPRRRAWPARGTLAAAALHVVAIGALFVAWLPQLREDLGVLVNPGPPDPWNVPLLSLRHLANVANELFLLGPLTIAGLALLPLAWKREWLPRPILAGGLPFLAVALVVRSNYHGLGPIRDWDVFAPAGFFLCLTAAAALARLVEERRERRAVAWACVLIGTLSSGAWLAVNASPSRALARAERTTYGAPPVAKEPTARALDALANLHLDQGNTLAAARAHLRAAELFENARYVWSAGISFWQAGRTDTAATLFLRAARNPQFRARLIQAAGGAFGPPPGDPMLRTMWQAIALAEDPGGAAWTPFVDAVATGDSSGEARAP